MSAWLLATLIAMPDIVVQDGELADCSMCHTSASWRHVSFDHGQTLFPLEQRHDEVPCRACHHDLRQMGLDVRCASCHRDVHAGRLGRACDRCHEADSFRSGAGVRAHGRSRFPLYGRHAMVPCDQCHRARADRTFGNVRIRCEQCHRAAYERTVGSAVDHVSGGVSTDCVQCHSAASWGRATLTGHDRCFPITRGSHRSIACRRCHTSLTGLEIGSCASFTADCTRCHRCNEMDKKHREEEGIAGYQCAARKCYECHPDGRGEGEEEGD